MRLVAAVYDLLPLVGLWFVAGALALAVTAGELDPHRFLHKLLVQGLVLALTLVYFVVSWLRGGQTLGMRAWHLRVVRADGGRVDAMRALLRFGVAMISLAAAGIGFAWALFDPQRRAWHDIAAHTLVVRIEAPPAK